MKRDGKCGKLERDEMWKANGSLVQEKLRLGSKDQVMYDVEHW